MSDEFDKLTFADLQEKPHVRVLVESCVRDRLAHDPADVAALITMGDIMMIDRNHVKALVFYKRALNVNPLDPKAAASCAVACIAFGEVAEAEEFYKTALELRPGDSRLMNDLALCLWMQDKVLSAVDMFEASINANSRFADPHYHLALIYSNVRNVRQAEDHAWAAMTLSDRSANWDLKAKAAELHGRIQAAKVWPAHQFA